MVTITQVDNGGRVLALASGFVVSPSGVIVTNYHVITTEPGAVQLVVKLPRGDSFTDVRMVDPGRPARSGRPVRQGLGTDRAPESADSVGSRSVIK